MEAIMTNAKIDKLDRQDFINFMENLILNSDSYKRSNESKSYVIALDSAWGTGKSYFIDLLTQDIDTNKNIKYVKYNAWENDYCDNAFNPLIYDILNSECLNSCANADAENTKNLLREVFKIGTVFAKQYVCDTVKTKTGFDIEKALSAISNSEKSIKDFMYNNIPNIAELNEQRRSFSNFKKYLNNATQVLKEHNFKLVVIIDELDRCKPTFAIQTLEIVKHIFDIENTVFLFAVDIEQLSHSISSVYGQGFDSVGYLCRFFDYIAKIPSTDILKFVESSLSTIDIGGCGIKSHDDKTFNENIVEYISILFKDFNLSLRDLDTIIKNYKIMFDNFLKDYKLSLAHLLYLFFLTFKYKKPNLFESVFIAKNKDKNLLEEYDKLKGYASAAIPSVACALKHIRDDNILLELHLPLFCDYTGRLGHDHVSIISVSNNSIQYKKTRTDIITRPISNDSYQSYNNMLFAPDLENWEQIKKYTYGEYIHRQLENYNFVYIDTATMLKE